MYELLYFGGSIFLGFCITEIRRFGMIADYGLERANEISNRRDHYYFSTTQIIHSLLWPAYFSKYSHDYITLARFLARGIVTHDLARIRELNRHRED